MTNTAVAAATVGQHVAEGGPDLRPGRYPPAVAAEHRRYGEGRRVARPVAQSTTCVRSGRAVGADTADSRLSRP